MATPDSPTSTPAPSLAWTISPIGFLTSSRREVVDDDWGDIEATIRLVAPFGASAVLGLDEFSHLEVIYLFDRVDPESVHTGSRCRATTRRGPRWASSPSG